MPRSAVGRMGHSGNIRIGGVPSMFGQPDDVLIAHLDTLRRRLCQYGPDAERCDCKFGATGKGEQSGCPEVRQAIAIISGQREQVAITKELFEQSAANTLRHIERILADHSGSNVEPA